MIRITAGRWRGKSVASPKTSLNLPEVRPTTSLMRESVFNRLQTRLVGSCFLDCFSGSGIMGIEALSRGADFVLAIEQNRQHAKGIKISAEKIGVPPHQYKLAQHDAIKYLSKQNKHRPFDIVFADPPYAYMDYDQLLVSLTGNGWLSDDAVVIIEHEKNKVLPEAIEINGQNKSVSRKIFGDACLSIY